MRLFQRRGVSGALLKSVAALLGAAWSAFRRRWATGAVRAFFKLILGPVLVVPLSGCVAHQARINTLEMIGDIARVRNTQVLRNLSAAISDRDGVPAVVVLGAGQATASVSAGVDPDAIAHGAWTAQWQISTVTNSEDLRRLRNLYALITATDAQYDIGLAYFRATPGDPERRLRRRRSHDEVGDRSRPVGGRPSERGACRGAVVLGRSERGVPAGFGPGRVATWRLALNVIEVGDSPAAGSTRSSRANLRRPAPDCRFGDGSIGAGLARPGARIRRTPRRNRWERWATGNWGPPPKAASTTSRSWSRPSRRAAAAASPSPS